MDKKSGKAGEKSVLLGTGGGRKRGEAAGGMCGRGSIEEQMLGKDSAAGSLNLQFSNTCSLVQSDGRDSGGKGEGAREPVRLYTKNERRQDVANINLRIWPWSFIFRRCLRVEVEDMQDRLRKRGSTSGLRVKNYERTRSRSDSSGLKILVEGERGNNKKIVDRYLLEGD